MNGLNVDQLLGHSAPYTVKKMCESANTFLGSLTSDQIGKVMFPFSGDERYMWHYTPVERNGLWMRDMTDEQRELALSLMDSGLSVRTSSEARAIVNLETVLGETERIEGLPVNWEREPDRYWFSVFGEPCENRPWAWRVGGHHIGVHLTVINNNGVTSMPLFLGVNPAEIQHGPNQGNRILAREEDLGRSVLNVLSADEKKIAIVDSVAPTDIRTRNYRTVNPDDIPHGLRIGSMAKEATERVIELVRHYVERSPEDVAANEWARIVRAGLHSISFAWAGPEERACGNGHYYAVRGPTFLIEYDNTQNDANHIHSVMRDFTNDWAEDLLAVHYENSHTG